MSPLDLTIDAVALVWVLYRQRRVRRVRLRFTGPVPVVLLVVGLFEFVHYNEAHSLGAEVSALIIGSLLVAAPLLGAIRAHTVRLIPLGRGAMAQQGTWLTMGLWLVSVGLHFALSGFISALRGPIGVTAASQLLYLAISLGVQNSVVRHRAVRALMRDPGGAGAHADAVEARSWEDPRD